MCFKIYRNVSALCVSCNFLCPSDVVFGIRLQCADGFCSCISSSLQRINCPVIAAMYLETKERVFHKDLEFRPVRQGGNLARAVCHVHPRRAECLSRVSANSEGKGAWPRLGVRGPGGFKPSHASGPALFRPRSRSGQARPGGVPAALCRGRGRAAGASVSLALAWHTDRGAGPSVPSAAGERWLSTSRETGPGKAAARGAFSG